MPRLTTRSLPLAAALAGALAACSGDAERASPRAASSAATPRADSARHASSARIGACWPSPTITEGGVGTVRVGRTVGQLARTCTARDTTFTLGEGMTETARVVRFEGHEVVALTTASRAGIISRVLVTDPAFRTAAGVGAGSTVGELRRAYPGPLCTDVGEGTVAVRVPALAGVSFATTATPGPTPNATRTPPDSARVTRVWLYHPTLDAGRGCER